MNQRAPRCTGVAKHLHDRCGQTLVVTANRHIAPPAYPFFIRPDWPVRYRHERIGYLLAATPRYDVASMQKLQGDQLSVATLRLLLFLNQTLGMP